MTFNWKMLGGTMVAVGPLIINFGPFPFSWWCGFFFTTIGPFLMAVEFKKKTNIKPPRTRP